MDTFFNLYIYLFATGYILKSLETHSYLLPAVLAVFSCQDN